MAKRNGAAAFVEIIVVPNYRTVTVMNVERYEHRELLVALHAFYDGKPGYQGMPEPEIVEREIKLQ